MYQDPVVNATVLTKTGYDSNFDKILNDFQNSIDNNANHNPIKDEWFDKVKSFFESK